MANLKELIISNDMLLNAIEAVAVRLNAQEAIMAAVATKLSITKEEAFEGLKMVQHSEMEY